MMTLGAGSAVSTAGPHAFFARWVDHDTWPQWSPDTDWVRVQGPVVEGVRGVLKPKGGPRVRFEVSTCEPGREYADTSFLPGARLLFSHTAHRDGDLTRLGVLVGISGPLAPLWGRLLGSGFRESAQADLDRLVTLVEGDARSAE